MLMTGDEFSVYWHIPFCKRKCDYCHFYVLPDREQDKDLLLEGFHNEWLIALPKFLSSSSLLKLESIYFGGGTPSLFGPSRIAQVLDWIRATPLWNSEIEITLEANPETISQQVAQEYRAIGINRVSLGVQSLDPDELVLLGRGHGPERALNAVETLVQSGLNNISIDLMYDLPTQTLKTWKNTLLRAAELPITHLSLYNLTIEPATIFFKKQQQLKPLLPDEEVSFAMHRMALEVLGEAGFERYEISAFAKQGLRSRHNVGYWTDRPFWGFGPSAYSYWDRARFRNVPHLKRYSETVAKGALPIDDLHALSAEESGRELLALALRVKEGASLRAIQNRYGQFTSHTWKTIETLLQEGFLEQKEERLVLTDRGRLFYDTVASELI